MVNELRELMREATDRPPQDTSDLRALVGAGRRRLRVRRATQVGVSALAAGAIGVASTWWLNPSPPDLAAAGVPRAEGPVIGLAGARAAVEGTDYRELTSYTNEDLNADNGQYFDGVTDDGLILFRDGPRSDQLYPRFALMDAATGEKEWLPRLDTGQSQMWPAELSRERLVLLSPDASTSGNGLESALVAHVFDRSTDSWSTLQWPGLPDTDGPWGARVGPDGRLYAKVPATRIQVPEGGWPMGPDGEADDSGASGESFDLWSVSLSDPSDVRDEGLRVGSFDFDGDALVWTDSDNGAAGQVHVRDLTSGEETTFDPELGERCNLLGFDVAGGKIAMSQYCGTYEGGVRDDRVQVMTTEGEPIVTIQDSGVEGGDLVAGGDFLTLASYDRATGGTYVYDFEEGRLLRLSDGQSAWSMGGPTPGDQFMWHTPAGRKVAMFGNSGATIHLGEIIR